MKKSVLVNGSVLFFLVLAGITLFSCNTQIPKANLKTNIDSISYAHGVMYASQIDQLFAQLNLDESNKMDFIKNFIKGFEINQNDKKATASIIGKMIGFQMRTQFVPYFNEQLFGNDSTQTISHSNFVAGYIAGSKNDTTAPFTRKNAQEYSLSATEIIRNSTMERQYADIKKENLEWLEKNKKKEGVITLSSGLQYKIVKEGKGLKPVATDTVKVSYKGMNIKNEVFDSSEVKNPVKFPLNNVIKGWAEALQLMPVGSKYILYIPYNLAYGEKGNEDNISPFATLIFEVELHEIVKNGKD